jgi:cyclohexa-1,5-dienecarbonyl-CoA hydratase
MTSAPVQVTYSHQEQWAHLTLYHPKGNILTIELLEALVAALERLRGERRLKLLTIEGQGADFSFGAAVEEHLPGEIERALPVMHRTVLDLLAFPPPTAAVVRGRCLGGGFEIALACDFLFASETAVLGLPEIGLGVFPPAASALLPARIGQARATHAVLTGQARPVAEWVESGLVELIAPLTALPAKVERWFEAHLKPRSAAALRHATRAVRHGLSQHTARVLPDLERQYLLELMRTRDAVEGVRAFVDRRVPEWQDS